MGKGDAATLGFGKAPRAAVATVAAVAAMALLSCVAGAAAANAAGNANSPAADSPVGASAAASEPSPLEKYRVEANYGRPDALLNGVFERNGKLELTLGYGYSAFSTLMNYHSAVGSLTWHINRRHAIEPFWFNQSILGGLTSFDRDQVAAKKPAKASTLSVERPAQIFAASYFFSPYHAKMHITERTVTHFDTYLGLGFAMLRSEALFLDDHKGPLQMRPAAALTAGLRFLFEPRYALRAELRDFIHREENFDATMTAHTLQLSLGFSIFFGAFPERL